MLDSAAPSLSPLERRSLRSTGSSHTWQQQDERPEHLLPDGTAAPKSLTNKGKHQLALSEASKSYRSSRQVLQQEDFVSDHPSKEEIHLGHQQVVDQYSSETRNELSELDKLEKKHAKAPEVIVEKPFKGHDFQSVTVDNSSAEKPVDYFSNWDDRKWWTQSQAAHPKKTSSTKPVEMPIEPQPLEQLKNGLTDSDGESSAPDLEAQGPPQHEKKKEEFDLGSFIEKPEEPPSPKEKPYRFEEWAPDESAASSALEDRDSMLALLKRTSSRRNTRAQEDESSDEEDGVGRLGKGMLAFVSAATIREQVWLYSERRSSDEMSSRWWSMAVLVSCYAVLQIAPLVEASFSVFGMAISYRGLGADILQQPTVNNLRPDKLGKVCDIAFLNPFYMFAVLIIWTCAGLYELRHPLLFTRSFLQMPNADISKVLQAEKESSDVIVKGLTTSMKVLLGGVMLTQTSIVVLLNVLGCKWLLATQNPGILCIILVGLGLMLKLQYLFYFLLPKRMQQLSRNTLIHEEGGDLPRTGNESRVAEMALKALIVIPVILWVWLWVYVFLKQPQPFPGYVWHSQAVCAS
mmetsp:Transcript_19725/g.35029  ORF Transcript_19725/g.35029 Transcript_19725/m.35029 type:complete len:575 (+) Transcript_19725:88-1812(+)